MKTPNMLGNVNLYDSRLIISYDIGRTCTFDCIYCYNNEDIEVGQVSDLEKLIKNLPIKKSRFKIVTAGCEQELFLNPRKALEFLKIVEKLGKIISFSTKVPLSRKVIQEIKDINERLKAKGGYVAGEVSFVSGNERPDLELRAPKVSSRIKTLENLNRAGIYSIPFIRPILPDEMVKAEEIYKLVTDIAEFAEVYAIGDFYFNKAIAERMKLENLGRSFHGLVQEDVKAEFFDIENNIWFKYVNEDKKSRVKRFIESKGRFCYDSSTKAILHFQRR